jgi:hypothetical protein
LALLFKKSYLLANYNAILKTLISYGNYEKSQVIIFFTSFSFCFAQYKEKFSVTYNRNIESYFLAELLAVDYRKTNRSFEAYKRTECRKYQPIIEETIKKYGYLKKSGIAKLTAALNATLGYYGMGNDALMAPLLYQKEFPASDYNSGYKFKDNHLSAEKQSVIDSIIKK